MLIRTKNAQITALSEAVAQLNDTLIVAEKYHHQQPLNIKVLEYQDWISMQC